jgi:hypothetical protein
VAIVRYFAGIAIRLARAAEAQAQAQARAADADVTSAIYGSSKAVRVLGLVTFPIKQTHELDTLLALIATRPSSGMVSVLLFALQSLDDKNDEWLVAQERSRFCVHIY